MNNEKWSDIPLHDDGLVLTRSLSSPPSVPPSLLPQVRGKAISLHSQAITEFCYFVGAQGKTRNRLIKKAKTNGDDLGFLW